MSLPARLLPRDVAWLAAAALNLISMAFPAAFEIKGTPALAVDGLFFILSGLFFAVAVSHRLDGARFGLLVATMALAAAGLTFLVHQPGIAGHAGAHLWLKVLALWCAAWALVETLCDRSSGVLVAEGLQGLLPPVLFGVTLLLLWEWITVGAGVPRNILPAPSGIATTFVASLPTLWVDFQRTFLLEALLGWALGSVAGFLVAILADKAPFLRRGLLPLGSFVSALPLIGVAPIMVTWLGNSWHPIVAVVVLMTFFPMLVNAVAGLAASGAMERDLMRSYGASWGGTLLYLRLPAAMPFIFNGLKINSTLAMIGAIVSEYFGRETFGMGFRINTQAGLSNMDLVWSEIAVAALAGSLFYAAIARTERHFTFWHPSYRRA